MNDFYAAHARVLYENKDALGSSARKGPPSTKDIAIVATGAALATVQANLALSKQFIRLGKLCRVVIACRVSPSQKAVIVQMVRKSVLPFSPVTFQDESLTTLAIGDGANDVSMIT